MKNSKRSTVVLLATAVAAAFAFSSCSNMDRTSSRKMGNPKTQTTQSNEPKP